MCWRSGWGAEREKLEELEHFQSPAFQLKPAHVLTEKSREVSLLSRESAWFQPVDLLCRSWLAKQQLPAQPVYGKAHLERCF